MQSDPFKLWEEKKKAKKVVQNSLGNTNLSEREKVLVSIITLLVIARSPVDHKISIPQKEIYDLLSGDCTLHINPSEDDLTVEVKNYEFKEHQEKEKNKWQQAIEERRQQLEQAKEDGIRTLFVDLDD